MSEFQKPIAIMVLGNPLTRLGEFVESNLQTSNFIGHFVDSTESFLMLELEPGPTHLVVIEPDWGWFHTVECQGARLFNVQWRGENWSPPWEDAGFEVRDPYVDGLLFQKHILAWLSEK